jgi:hypothetical protein
MQSLPCSSPWRGLPGSASFGIASFTRMRIIKGVDLAHQIYLHNARSFRFKEYATMSALTIYILCETTFIFVGKRMCS